VNPDYSERIVQFTGLDFGSRDRRTENAYKQIHLRVLVDSGDPKAYSDIEKIKPKLTPASNGEEKQSSSTKSGRSRAAAANLDVGAIPRGSVSGSFTWTNEKNDGSERVRYTSTITKQDKGGKIWWNYGIYDDNYRDYGYNMPKDVLPTVPFRFYGRKSPPKHMGIVITSYWSKISRTQPGSELKRKKFWHLLRPTDKTQPVSFSNLFQIVALTADVDNLRKSNIYGLVTVKMHLDSESGVSEPLAPEPDDQRPEAESPKIFEGIPVVVDADGMYIILLTWI
jgi:hypothetical protein